MDSKRAVEIVALEAIRGRNLYTVEAFPEHDSIDELLEALNVLGFQAGRDSSNRIECKFADVELGKLMARGF
jgi:hypothetical protein